MRNVSRWAANAKSMAKSVIAVDSNIRLRGIWQEQKKKEEVIFVSSLVSRQHVALRAFRSRATGTGSSRYPRFVARSQPFVARFSFGKTWNPIDIHPFPPWKSATDTATVLQRKKKRKKEKGKEEEEKIGTDGDEDLRVPSLDEWGRKGDQVSDKNSLAANFSRVDV